MKRLKAENASLKAKQQSHKRGHQGALIADDNSFACQDADGKFEDDDMMALELMKNLWGRFKSEHMAADKHNAGDCMIETLTWQCPGNCKFRHDVCRMTTAEVETFLDQPRVKALMPGHLIKLMPQQFREIVDPARKRAKLANEGSLIAKTLNCAKKK